MLVALAEDVEARRPVTIEDAFEADGQLAGHLEFDGCDRLDGKVAEARAPGGLEVG